MRLSKPLKIKFLPQIGFLSFSSKFLYLSKRHSNAILDSILARLAPMTPGGSDNRLAIFNFDTFFDPGSIAELKLSLNIEGRGTWVPIKSLSQSEQGIWAIYTVNDKKVVIRDLVEILYFKGEYAFVNGTLNDGDLVVLGGAQKIIEGKSLNIQ